MEKKVKIKRENETKKKKKKKRPEWNLLTRCGSERKEKLGRGGER
jgi:hypothetical protein